MARQQHWDLYDAVTALRTRLPEVGEITVVQAQESEGIVRLYIERFRELPRTKVDEVVEGLWTTGKGALQAGLVGATAVLSMAYGLPATAGIAIGALAIAPKNAVEIIKAGRELFVPSK